jgi:hypothetical protein
VALKVSNVRVRVRMCVQHQVEPGGEVKAEHRDRRRFILHVDAGSFTDSEIIVMLGEVRLVVSTC